MLTFNYVSGNRRLLLTLCFLLSSLFLYAVHGIRIADLSQDLNWKFDQTYGGVDFYYSITSCSGNSTVFLKINNKNSFPVEIAWKELFDTQAEKSVEGYKGQKKLIVQPGETYESNCINPTHSVLMSTASSAIPTYIAIISKFSYKDVSVNRIN